MPQNGLPILYSFRRCPYAMRARMAIWISGLKVQLREVVLRDKPSHMLAISPKGTVPVLQLPDGVVVDESLDVMLWALGLSDPEKWLEPEIEDLEAMLGLIAACDGDFKHHLDRYKYASRYEGAVAIEHREAAEGFLLSLETRLSSHAYLFGQRASLADFAIMPFVRQFANTDRHWFDSAHYPQLQNWLATLLEDAPFTHIMKKYPQWVEGDEPVVFERGTAS